MKKLIAVTAVVAAFGIIAACSQGDTHPPFLGDCDACNKQPVSTGGDAAADASKPDTSTTDSSTQDATGNDSSADSSTSDAAGDAANDGGNDGALLDSGLLD